MFIFIYKFKNIKYDKKNKFKVNNMKINSNS